MYIDYEYYANTFGGNLVPQNEFNKYATNASMRVKTAIFNRDISLFEDDVKTVTCSIVDVLYNQKLNQERLNKVISGTDALITSEKVGDYSRNMTNLSLEDLEKYASDDYTTELIKAELENYLFYTGLLYSGIDYV